MPFERPTSLKSSALPQPPIMPSPCTPPQRPPRPKISLPNMRPTIVLSPLAIPACIYRLPPSTQSITAIEDSFVREVLAAWSHHVEMQSLSMKPSSPTGPHLSSSQAPTKHAFACNRTVSLDDRSVVTSKTAQSGSTCMGSAWTCHVKGRNGGGCTSDMECVQRYIDTCPLSWLGRNRRLIWMLATLCFVVVSAAAIAGGIIWRLTVIH
ncbi:hypothetical protein EDD37DRAFT_214064 [Exophiala viscosa]|uniref:uncharacterized protein n=1 Tax=Exophiala viscosa TaxID=2486360 RepID=UPI00219BF0CF|nr:hypothetical protein EDD37DRAFT_214064 [Exophiala viscosa]